MSDNRPLLKDDSEGGDPYSNHVTHDNTIQAQNAGFGDVPPSPVHYTSATPGQLPPYLVNNSAPANKDTTLVKSDPKRWYILLLFASLGFTQGLIWNTWGPIAESSEFVFGWTDATIALMSNWGPIAYIVVTLLFSWLMDVKGLRAACLLTMVCVTLGAGLRCITSHTPTATWLIHVGQMFNGIGGPVAMGGPPVLSAVWFPVHQRTTATALSAGINGLGVAVSYVIGPQLVPDVENKTICVNKTVNHTSDIYLNSNCLHQKHVITQKIMLLMYIEFGLSAFIFLLMLIYFPSRPKISPSITAGLQRMDFVKGLKDLVRNGKFWMLAVPYSLAGGVFGGWQSVLDVILKPHNITEDTAGWIGFWGTIAGQLSGLVVGLFADIFAKRMRVFLIVLFSGATLVFAAFALECTGIWPINIPSLYALNILGNTFLYGTTPLFFELGCESSYPVAEGITNGVMTWLNNAVGLVFLLVLMIPNIGTIWMNWCLMGCIAACIPIFLFYRERYGRYDIDVVIETEVNAQPQQDASNS